MGPLEAAVPFDDTCYTTCRAPGHGIERWSSQTTWGPVGSGWVSGGHDRASECQKLIAAALVNSLGSSLDLAPGDAGMWDENKNDITGRVEYKYFCRGTLKSARSMTRGNPRLAACETDR